MRADRLLSIMLMLQNAEHITAAELADRLEVSERTIHRDMLALSTAGIPVLSERGRSGGWKLMEGYRTTLTGMNLAEIQALFIQQPGRVLADLGLEAASESALIKMLASLPATHRESAAFVQQRLYVDSAGWRNYEEDTTWLTVIQQAVWQGCRLNLTYQRRGGEGVMRTVDPLGLVAKGSVWYLVAQVEDDFRTYRISRVEEASLCDEPAQRPADFDLAAYWQQSKAEFMANLPKYYATLRVQDSVKHMLKVWRFARTLAMSEPDEDGWVTAEVCFEVDDEAWMYVLGLGPQVEVIAPEELKQKVLDGARAVVARYVPDTAL